VSVFPELICAFRICAFRICAFRICAVIYRGPSILETTKLRYWIGFFLSAAGSAVLCVAILKARHVPPGGWASGMLLLAIPG
jgi:hypothetical protein